MRLVRCDDLALVVGPGVGYRTGVNAHEEVERVRRLRAALGVSDEEAVEQVAVTIESALGADTNWWQALRAAKAVLEVSGG